MEAKIDFKNLAKENIAMIAARLGDLNEDFGDVFAWTSDSVSVTKPERFSSEENAKEYGILKNEFYMRRGMIDRNKPINYMIGMEKDYQNAVKICLRRKKNEEVKKYREHVEKLVDRSNKEILALKALKSVCRTFDGKVINKQFTEAVGAATGCHCYFDDDSLNLVKNSCAGPYKEIHVRLYYRWYKKFENFWQWKPRDRMEAEKAVSIIDIEISELQHEIKRLHGTRKNYAKYVAKVRKVEKLIEELIREDVYIRGFAMDHDLQQYPLVTGIWKCS